MRIFQGETFHFVARLQPGRTVTVAVYDVATGLALPISGSTNAIEITPGIYKWLSTNLQNVPAIGQELVGVFTSDRGQVEASYKLFSYNLSTAVANILTIVSNFGNRFNRST
jgi:hypothetical protein